MMTVDRDNMKIELEMMSYEMDHEQEEWVPVVVVVVVVEESKMNNQDGMFESTD